MKHQINIIGFGLAGATLAWQFHFKNIPFKIYDSGSNHCTRTAAGLVNPIVFKRLTKSWNIDLLLPEAFDFYTRIENTLKTKLISGKKILYPFTTKEDENNWSVKMGDDRFRNYLNHTNSAELNNIHAPNGVGLVNTFGNIDTNLFLDLSRQYFLSNGIEFFTEELRHENAAANADQKYIFCEGVAVTENPFFNYLPMKPAHGETLIIQTDGLELINILSKNLFLLPLGNNKYKVGATYNWELKKPILTEEGKNDLTERLKHLLQCNFEIISHQAGIRPAVADRRPLLGVHPEKKNLFIFNGLGTKGVLLAPYYAKHFADFLAEDKTLDAEVNITRFAKRYRKSLLDKKAL
ncbi:MAG: FAD-dependent oxidoreductase [Crocinitomicaceae bacterium]|nr:FAD-dependent oxidoreductase [Crocinitomicaceae bacterium]